MSSRALSGLILSLVILVFAAGGAIAADWRVAQMSGSVSVKSGAVQLVALTSGRVLKGGAVVVTGKNGRALLVRGQQTMIVSPGSAVTLPPDAGGYTRILERAGQVEYNVDHKDVQHFAVQTPYLAAVVKGTRFQVKVYKGGASVSVLRGRVEVTDLKSGQRVDVLPGQRAVVNAGQGLAIYGGGKIQPIRQANVRSLLKATGLVNANAGGVNANVGGLAGASVGAAGISASVGGGSLASVSAGGGGIGASVAGGAISANVGGGGISVGVGGISVGIH